MPRRKLKEPEAGSGILPPKKSMELRSVRDCRPTAKLIQKQANDAAKISSEPATKPVEEPTLEKKVPAKRGRKSIVKVPVSPTPESTSVANKIQEVPVVKVPVKDVEKKPESEIKLLTSPGKDLADGQTNVVKLSLASPVDQPSSGDMPKVVLPPCRVLLEARPNPPAAASDLGVLETDQASVENNSVAPHTVPHLIGANEVVEKIIGGRKRRSKNEISDGESTSCKQPRSKKGPVSPTESPVPSPKAKRGKASSQAGDIGDSEPDLTTVNTAEMVSENTRKRLHRTPPTITATTPTPSPISIKTPAASKVINKPQPSVANLPLSVSKETFDESLENNTTDDAVEIPDGNKVVVIGDVKPNIATEATIIQHSTVSTPSVKVPPPIVSNIPIRALADSTQCSPITSAHSIFLANPNVHSSIPVNHILPLTTAYSHKPFIPPPIQQPLKKMTPPCPAPQLASPPLPNEVVMKSRAKPRRRRSAALLEEADGDAEGGRLLMRDWLFREAEFGTANGGIQWYDRSQQMIKIAWKHASKTGWTERDSRVFVNWAKYTGRYDETEGHCKRWKANFRCAIHSLPDVQEIKLDKCSIVRSPGEQFKIYQLLPPAPRKRSRGGSGDSLPSPYRRLSSTKQEPDTSTSPLPQDESQLMEDEQAAQLISLSDLYAPSSPIYPISPAVTRVTSAPDATSPPSMIVYCHQDQMPHPHDVLNPGLSSQFIYYIGNPLLPTAPDHSYANAVATGTDVKPPISTVTNANAVTMATDVKPAISTVTTMPLRQPSMPVPAPSSSKPRSVMIPTMVEVLNLSSDEDEEEETMKDAQQLLTTSYQSDVDSTSHGVQQAAVFTSAVAMTTQQPISVVAMPTQQPISAVAMPTQQLATVTVMTTQQQPSFINILSPSAYQPTSSLQQQESYHEMQPLQLTDMRSNQSAALPAVSVVLNVDGVFDQDSPPRPTDLDEHFEHHLDLRSIFG